MDQTNEQNCILSSNAYKSKWKQYSATGDGCGWLGYQLAINSYR